MSDLNWREVNSAEIKEETPNLNGQEMGAVNGANSSPDSPVTSQAVAQQMRVMIGLLPRQLELLCDLMKYPR